MAVNRPIKDMNCQTVQERSPVFSVEESATGPVLVGPGHISVLERKCMKVSDLINFVKSGSEECGLP